MLRILSVKEYESIPIFGNLHTPLQQAHRTNKKGHSYIRAVIQGKKNRLNVAFPPLKDVHNTQRKQKTVPVF